MEIHRQVTLGFPESPIITKPRYDKMPIVSRPGPRKDCPNLLSMYIFSYFQSILKPIKGVDRDFEFIPIIEGGSITH